MNFALIPRSNVPSGSNGLPASQLGFIGILNLNASSNMNNAIQLVDTDGATTVGNPQRLGEFAITGGRLDTQMSITPRDTPFKF